MATNGQILVILVFCRTIHLLFFWKITSNLVFKTKINKFNSGVWKNWPKMLKIVNFDPNLTIFAILGLKKLDLQFFNGHISSKDAQLHEKNQEKISNGLGCGTGTHRRTNRRTNGRTYESEFIGSFRSLKTSGEPIITWAINSCYSFN